MNINTKPSREGKLALGEISRMAFLLNLPIYAKERASILYLEARNKDLIRGRSTETVAGAVVYLVCREHEIPRIIEEIAEVSNSSLKKIRTVCLSLLDKMELKLPPISAILFIPNFCSKLDLGAKTVTKAIMIVKAAEQAELTNGRGQMGIAAATIYIAAIINGEHRTQKEVSKVTGVSEVTIRNRYKEFSDLLDIPELLEL